MKKISVLLLLVLFVGLLSGCITQLKSNVTPGTQLASMNKFYIVHLEPDDRGTDRLIAERLNTMGKQATTGAKDAVPADADAVITYQDKWMWDMTMYMVELNVQVRQPKSDITVASGHTLRSSFARKKPAAMVEEVLNDLFKK